MENEDHKHQGFYQSQNEDYPEELDNLEDVLTNEITEDGETWQNPRLQARRMIQELQEANPKS